MATKPTATSGSPKSLELLATYRHKIDAQLVQFFDTVPNLLKLDLSDESKQALEHIREYTLRPAKRLRGALAAFSYDSASGETFSQTGLQLAVVLELLQSYLLIIDDVMDKSDTRRGQPTVHKLYEPAAKAYGGLHEAEMLAVDIGVLTQHLANLALITIPLPASLVPQLMTRLHVNISATAFGQLDDLYQQPGRNSSEADIIRKYCLKSSYYTFINPLQLGLTAADKASAEVLAACQKFGELAGIAFQLHDDYLGIFGDDKQTGKSNLDDIREGKYTLLVHYALQQAATSDVQKLKAILGNPLASSADSTIVQDIFTQCGAKEYTQKLARTYAEDAKQQLDQQPIGRQPFQNVLVELVTYSIERQQ